MALITAFVEEDRRRHSVHGPVECAVTSFENNGRVILQLDTYGSKSRKLRGKVSQSIQLDSTAAKKLHALIAKTFKL